MHPELVKLHIGGLVLVRLAILKALNGGNGAVLDLDVPSIELLLPICVCRSGLGLSLRGLGAVDERDDVGELGVHLQHAAKHVRQVAEDAKGLITVLVAIAPRAPEDTLAPGFLQTGSIGKHIPHTGAENDLTSSVVLSRGIDNRERSDCVSTNGSDRLDGRVLDMSRGVLEDLLASQGTELGGGSACVQLVGESY